MKYRWQKSQAARSKWLKIILLWMILSGCSTGSMPYHIEIQPESVAVNAPCTQHEVVAYVTDKDGKPICNCPVEWTLPRSRDAVGAIVEAPDLWGSKKTNTYARTMTDEEGKARIIIASPQEGRTPIIALAPDIQDKQHHKVFAVKHWLKAAWHFPSDEPAPAGGSRDLTTYVYRASCDDADASYPLPGYRVEWELLANFKVTPESLEALAKRDLPDKAQQKLTTIQGQVFVGKRAFLRRVAELIGNAQTHAYRQFLVEHARQPLGPPAYFRDPTTGEKTTHIIVETNTSGLSSLRLFQDHQHTTSGKNKIDITIRHPDNTDELCCPYNNDAVGSWRLTQTWTPAN